MSLKTDVLHQKFVPLKVKSMLHKLRENGYSQECDDFLSDIMKLYSACVEYMSRWTNSFHEFNCFNWMKLARNGSSIPKWETVESCIPYLSSRGVVLDDAKLFDQFHRLVNFADSQDKHLTN